MSGLTTPPADGKADAFGSIVNAFPVFQSRTMDDENRIQTNVKNENPSSTPQHHPDLLTHYLIPISTMSTKLSPAIVKIQVTTKIKLLLSLLHNREAYFFYNET